MAEWQSLLQCACSDHPPAPPLLAPPRAVLWSQCRWWAAAMALVLLLSVAAVHGRPGTTLSPRDPTCLWSLWGRPEPPAPPPSPWDRLQQGLQSLPGRAQEGWQALPELPGRAWDGLQRVPAQARDQYDRYLRRVKSPSSANLERRRKQEQQEKAKHRRKVFATRAIHTAVAVAILRDHS
uniref:Uncharacterized protein n=1 Tax=Eutreptiella gymnastica TaxID=73025 RepID=A0A7S1NSA5_9EUGL